MEFSEEMKDLKPLFHALEKQVIQFNEIIPYDKQNSTSIYSPLLVNMLVSAGPQIESIVKLLKKQLQITTSGHGIPKIIESMNQNNVLHDIKIISTLTNKQFSPFEKNLDWWNAYNIIKHDLSQGQFKVGYHHLMNAMAALSIFHYLASLCSNDSSSNSDLLNHSYWMFNNPMLYHEKPVLHKHAIIQNGPWKSSLFKIYSSFFGRV